MPRIEKHLQLPFLPSLSHKESDIDVKVHETRMHKGNPWTPGPISRFPWKAFGALMLVIGCLVGAIKFIFHYDKRPYEEPNVPIAVVLSIFTSIISLMTRVLLDEGLNINWWRVAMRGAKVQELHNHWEFGTSKLAATLSFFTFSVNRTAVASLLTLLTLANGPLLQRSLYYDILPLNGTYFVNITTTQSLFKAKDGLSNTKLPLVKGAPGYLWTGNIEEPNSTIGGLSKGYDLLSFADPAFGYIDSWDGLNDTIEFPANCSDSCIVEIPGFGFKPLACGYTMTHLSMTKENQTSPQKIFGIDVYYGDYAYNSSGHRLDTASNRINVSFTYLGGHEFSLWEDPPKSGICRGVLTQMTCSFIASKVNYSAIVSQDNTTILKDPSTDYNRTEYHVGDVYGDPIDMPESLGTGQSSLGGFALSLRNRFSGEANMDVITINGTKTWRMRTEGASSNFVSGDEDEDGGRLFQDCEVSTDSPYYAISDRIRYLAFKLTNAIVLHNNITERDAYSKKAKAGLFEAVTVKAADENSGIVSLVDKTYIWPAVAGTFVAVISVLFLFYGWAHAGRATSLSPIETGRAMGAPSLRNSDPNSNIGGILKEIGMHQLRYGAVVSLSDADATGNKLELADSGLVRRPNRGETFTSY